MAKTCTACGVEKQDSEFYRTSGCRCKSCFNAQSVRNYRRRVEAKGTEASREEWRQRYAGNPGAALARSRKWRERNPEKFDESSRRTKVKLYHMTCVWNAERSQQLKQATPPWADRERIAEVYVEARRKQVQTGEPWHVDHIVPLNGKTVSGLHVEYNLRPLPARENMRKGNRLQGVGT